STPGVGRSMCVAAPSTSTRCDSPVMASRFLPSLHRAAPTSTESSVSPLACPNECSNIMRAPQASEGRSHRASPRRTALAPRRHVVADPLRDGLLRLGVPAQEGVDVRDHGLVLRRVGLEAVGLRDQAIDASDPLRRLLAAVQSITDLDSVGLELVALRLELLDPLHVLIVQLRRAPPLRLRGPLVGLLQLAVEPVTPVAGIDGREALIDFGQRLLGGLLLTLRVREDR